MKITRKICYVLLTSLLVFTSCCENCEKQNAERPKEAITYKDAKKLQKVYIGTHVKPTIELYKSVGVEKKDEVRDVTFDLKVVKQYIAYIEKEAAKKGIKKGLGLRVYLGAYKKGDVTMFMMPTRKKEDKTNASKFFYFAPDDVILEDVDGLNYGSGGKPPKDLK